jgi:hypothetical protein
MTGFSMRKLILIAAMSLLATQAYAGGSRSLSLAASNANEQATGPTTQTPATTTQTLAITQPTVTPATTAPTATPVATTSTPQTTAPVATTTEPAKTTAATKPKPRQPSVEARVIRELHRHGIYW